MKVSDRKARQLQASLCSRCGQISYPPDDICASCGHQEASQRIELSSGGTLYTFTVVHAAAPGVETPYAIGYVDFAEGVRVFGRVMPYDRLSVGMNMQVVSEREGNGESFWFEPAGTNETES